MKFCGLETLQAPQYGQEPISFDRMDDQRGGTQAEHASAQTGPQEKLFMEHFALQWLFTWSLWHGNCLSQAKPLQHVVMKPITVLLEAQAPNDLFKIGNMSENNVKGRAHPRVPSV